MLLLAGAIGPVLAGIGSLIGVLAGLLFNPVTLTALLIAVGIGGAIMGIRALWKWGRKKKMVKLKMRKVNGYVLLIQSS